MMKKNYPKRIVGNILGRKTGIRKDSKSNNMVRYNYFLIKLTDGSEFVEYAGSKKAAELQAEDKGIPRNRILKTKELSYTEASDALGHGKMDLMRGKTKIRYYNTGKLLLGKENEKGKTEDLVTLEEKKKKAGRNKKK